MNRKKCRHCKQYFRPDKPLQHYCLKPECVEEWVRVAREKEWKQRKAKLKHDLKSWQDWYNEALKWFNKYIRVRDKDKPCVSCGAKAGTYKITSGHYFPQGTYRNIGLDERNSHAQCWYNCNSSKSGNLAEYYPELIRRIGQDGYDDLVRLKNEDRKFTIEELKEKIEEFKYKIKQLS
jgi:hypothetical protein